MRKILYASLLSGALGVAALATPSLAAMHGHAGPMMAGPSVHAMRGPSAHYYGAPRIRAYSPGRPRVFAHNRRFHGRRVFFAAGYPYYYYNDYGYGGCGWLYRRAVATGSPYWWRRYHECVY
jgi:hypothetical protein